MIIARFRQCSSRQLGRTGQTATAFEHTSIAIACQRSSRQFRCSCQTGTIYEHRLIAVFRQGSGWQHQIFGSMILDVRVLFEQPVERIGSCKRSSCGKTRCIHQTHDVAIDVAICRTRELSVCTITGFIIRRVIAAEINLVTYRSQSNSRGIRVPSRSVGAILYRRRRSILTTTCVRHHRTGFHRLERQRFFCYIARNRFYRSLDGYIG